MRVLTDLIDVNPSWLSARSSVAERSIRPSRPTDVQLTSRSAACGRGDRARRRARARAPRARSGVRFQTDDLGGARLAQRPDRRARAAAGAEHERAACPRGRAPSAAIRPGRVGVLGGDRAVGARSVSVFAAPISRAASLASSASASAACLCGIVTFAPTKPGAARARARSPSKQLRRHRQQLVAPAAHARARRARRCASPASGCARPASRARRGAVITCACSVGGCPPFFCDAPRGRRRRSLRTRRSVVENTCSPQPSAPAT